MNNERGNVVGIGRILLIIITILLSILSFVIIIVAVATPKWQIVYLSEFYTEHYHGLWLDCVQSSRYSQGPSDEALQCTYKFENQELLQYHGQGSSIHNEEDLHRFQEWHKTVLIFFAITLICGFCALCLTFCSVCVWICSIKANILYLLAFLSSFIGLIIFFINSHRTDIRFVRGLMMTYEQYKGYSFYLAMFGIFGYFLTFILSVFATVLIYIHDRQNKRIDRRSHRINLSQRKTFPKNETTISAIAV